jgi:hypothetical protein
LSQEVNKFCEFDFCQQPFAFYKNIYAADLIYSYENGILYSEHNVVPCSAFGNLFNGKQHSAGI